MIIYFSIFRFIMKINESTLITYATSSTCPTDKEGWLHKRGEVNKNFQKRYFVLKGNLLFYFDKRFDKEPIGVIILEGCTIELADEEQEMCAFKIVFHGEATLAGFIKKGCGFVRGTFLQPLWLQTVVAVTDRCMLNSVVVASKRAL